MNRIHNTIDKFQERTLHWIDTKHQDPDRILSNIIWENVDSQGKIPTKSINENSRNDLQHGELKIDRILVPIMRHPRELSKFFKYQ